MPPSLLKSVRRLMNLSQQKQQVLLVVLYTAIIGGAVYWSGKFTSRTLYDKYIVLLEGVEIPVKNLDKAAYFYRNVLDFRPIYRDKEGKSDILGFELLEGRKIFLNPIRSGDAQSGAPTDPPEVSDPSVVVLRVRNGLEQLQQELVRKSKRSAPTLSASDSANKVPRGRVSNIVVRPYGEEFYVKDLDGNVLVFYRPNKRKGSRY